MRLRSLLLLLALGCGSVRASTWFVLLGDKAYPATDRAELDMDDVGPRGATRAMKLRVTLAHPRTMPDGEIVQSYFSHISIDCATGSIFHDDQLRYDKAEWKGVTTFERFRQPKPMAFYGLVPDPKQRVLDAACLPQAEPAQR